MEVQSQPGAWLAAYLAKNPQRMKRFPNAREEDESYVPVELEPCDEFTYSHSPEFDFE